MTIFIQYPLCSRAIDYIHGRHLITT